LNNSNQNKLKNIIFFDDECSLCLRFSQALKRIDSEELIEYYSIRESATFEKFPQMNPEECAQTVHMLTEEGKILKGSEVINHLITVLPGVSKFAWLLDNQVGKKTTELFHGVLQTYRESLLNRCPKCKKVNKEKCNNH
jgi:predicted DCC family thiol-disulfide oxidoreductase YuxK